MSDYFDLDLIRLFAFYLWLVFFISTFVRIRQYEAIIRIVHGDKVEIEISPYDMSKARIIFRET